MLAFNCIDSTAFFLLFSLARRSSSRELLRQQCVELPHSVAVERHCAAQRTVSPTATVEYILATGPPKQTPTRHAQTSCLLGSTAQRSRSGLSQTEIHQQAREKEAGSAARLERLTGNDLRSRDENSTRLTSFLCLAFLLSTIKVKIW